jgi:hypothetical protein
VKHCPICNEWRLRCEIDVVCPLCGAPGVKPELDALALDFIAAYEWYRDREIDHAVFGTALPLVN